MPECSTAFLHAARRQAMEADAFAGDMRAFFRGSDQEVTAKKLAYAVAGSAEDAAVVARKTGHRDAELDAAMKRARRRAEQFVQQHTG